VFGERNGVRAFDVTSCGIQVKSKDFGDKTSVRAKEGARPKDLLGVSMKQVIRRCLWRVDVVGGKDCLR